jgi:predicted lipid-binding transport protein (Tim44 family)
MGKKIKILLLLLIIFGSTNTNAQVYLDSLNKQANAMTVAYSKSDYKALLKLTHPKVVQTMGGIKSAEANLKRACRKLQQLAFHLRMLN